MTEKERLMKAELRKIAKRIFKQIPTISVNRLTDMIKDECIREHCQYTNELATWAADREVHKKNYSQIREQQKSGKGWG
jgi:hypothetical protein